MKPIKQKVCKESLGGCGKKFTPFQTTQKACGVHCAISMARVHGKKVAAKEHRQHKQEFYDNDRPRQMRLAQKSFNDFIRYRDRHLPCISCGTVENIQYHAGHFLSRGSSGNLRFSQFNTNKQCVRCNNYKSGNIGEYRIGLIKKFGIEKVEELENTNTPVKLSITDIRRINEYYKRLLRTLKQQ